MNPAAPQPSGPRTIRDLGRRGQVGELIVALDDPHWRVRRDAALELGDLRADVAPALAALLTDRHARVRVAAAHALGSLNTAEAAEALGQFVASLAGFDREGRERERYLQFKVLLEAAPSLGRLSDAGVPVPHEALAQLVAAVHECSAASQPVFRPLQRVGFTHDGAALEPLLRVVDRDGSSRSDGPSRRPAHEHLVGEVCALGELGDDRAREPLADILAAGDVTDEVRKHAADQLARLGDRRGIDYLLALARSNGPSKRGAAQSLADLTDQSLRGDLAELLAHRDPTVQTIAAIGLARLGDRSGAAILHSVIDDYRRNGRVRPVRGRHSRSIGGLPRSALAAFEDPLQSKRQGGRVASSRRIR